MKVFVADVFMNIKSLAKIVVCRPVDVLGGQSIHLNAQDYNNLLEHYYETVIIFCIISVPIGEELVSILWGTTEQGAVGTNAGSLFTF